jgi:biotin-(acetyl-CoA carboxylase) ligase
MSRKVWIEATEFGQEMEMIAACAVSEVVQDLLPLPEVTLKHPNDVRVDGKKICGCLVYPKYDSKSAIGKNRAVNLGVGINLAVAPESTQPTTCLANYNCLIGIPDFMKKFDAKFIEILTQYRAERNFNCVLRRMGFLDENGMLAIREAGGHIIITQYKGFESNADTNYMIFGNGDMRALRSFEIISGTQRNAIASHPTHTELAPHV